MTKFTRKVYEMLVRVGIFAATYPQFFPTGSLKKQLIDQIEAAASKLSSDALSERSGKGAVRSSSS